MSKNLTLLSVSSSFQRLLQIDPDNSLVINGTGSAYLIPTSSISNFISSVDHAASLSGYITETGVVFTTKSNTGSIRLKGDIELDGNINIKNNNTTNILLDTSGSIQFNDYTGDKNNLPAGSLIYSGSDFYMYV